MVRKNLMDIVTLSGIRKELLLYLNDGPHSLSEIRDQFDITSPEVSPRIKELMEHKLVIFEGKKYHLTSMGRTVIKNFLPFIDTLNVFEQYPNFWDEHDVSSIPDKLLFRIGEIKNFIIIEDDMDNVNRTFGELNKLVTNSKSLVGVTCVFDESFPKIFLKVAKSNTPVSIVVTKEIFNILKRNYANMIEEFCKVDNSIYLLEEKIKISHIVTDDCLYFALCYKNGKLDLHSNLVSNDPSSIKWGMDLFEYYRARSIKIDLSNYNI